MSCNQDDFPSCKKIFCLTYLANWQNIKVVNACSTAKPKTKADFRRAADVFKALSNPSRMMIVNALADGEHCVADLTSLVQLDISTVSNHLSVLRSVGIVSDERRGTQVFYTLRKPCLMNLFCCLEDFHSNE
jgi:DNA-binding transcriptional ArsR family regulator